MPRLRTDGADERIRRDLPAADRERDIRNDGSRGSPKADGRGLVPRG